MNPDLIPTAGCADQHNPDMSVDQARDHIRRHLSPILDHVHLPLKEALGRVLGSDILSPHNVPNHNNSAMDGYALNGDVLDSSGRIILRVAGTAFAGHPFDDRVEKEECVRIMTGAVIPFGCDTVVMQEHVQVEGNNINIREMPMRGQNVRLAGEDLQRGQVVFPAGHWLRPADLGLIASLGIGEVCVHRKLRVAIFSTGDELTSIGQPLEEGHVYDSNRYTLHGMLTRLGVEIIDLGVVRDDPHLLEQALTEATSKADVIITSGGVSVGEADFMTQLLSRLGQIGFWKIAMKPGRPLAYGKIGSTHYFGLPGNPVSAMVTFYQFVREAILILMGQTNPSRIPSLMVDCLDPIRKAPGRTEFQRGKLFQDEDGIWKVRPIGNQGSGVLRSMSEANCFIVLPDHCGSVAAGATVQVQLFEGII